MHINLKIILDPDSQQLCTGNKLIKLTRLQDGAQKVQHTYILYVSTWPIVFFSVQIPMKGLLKTKEFVLFTFLSW